MFSACLVSWQRLPTKFCRNLVLLSTMTERVLGIAMKRVLLQCRYQFQLSLGRKLAQRVRERKWEIDCIVPVPDGSRPAAIELSAALQLPYREGLVKNRYVGRTFIMPNQEVRELSVRRKLNAMPAVFAGKRVLLVDDSIVRGTTMYQIVEMVRKAGAQKVYLASASPPVKHPNVYGTISALGFIADADW